MQAVIVARIFHHVGQQFAEDRGIGRVQRLVGGPDGLGAVDVAPGIGIDDVLELNERDLAQMLEPAHQPGRRRLAMDDEHALGDVLGEIADAFEIAGNLQRADDLAQVPRHRLAPGDHRHRHIAGFGLEIVEPFVTLYDERGAAAGSDRRSASMASDRNCSASPPIWRTRTASSRNSVSNAVTV